MTIIGNWKSNKTIEQTQVFLEELAEFLFKNPQEKKEIIICPSFTCIKYASDFAHANDLKVQIGAQNISDKKEGAYTGEVAASQLQKIASCTIIGHSERRRFYGETEEMVAQKVKNAKEAGLKVILCLQNKDEKIEDVDYIAYEPPEAIGTGKPEDPKEIEQVLKKIKEKNTQAKLLYGGSVTEDNINIFAKIPNLEGFLVGGASLDATSFSSLITRC